MRKAALLSSQSAAWKSAGQRQSGDPPSADRVSTPPPSSSRRRSPSCRRSSDANISRCKTTIMAHQAVRTLSCGFVLFCFFPPPQYCSEKPNLFLAIFFLQRLLRSYWRTGNELRNERQIFITDAAVRGRRCRVTSQRRTSTITTTNIVTTN